MISIKEMAYADADQLKQAPLTMPVRRLDDVRAAKQPDLVWRPGTET